MECPYKNLKKDFIIAESKAILISREYLLHGLTAFDLTVVPN
jgi:hypothetical protein